MARAKHLKWKSTLYLRIWHATEKPDYVFMAISYVFFLLFLKIADPTPLLPAFMKFLHSIAACPTYKPLTNLTKLWSSVKEILPHFDLFITVISQTIKSAVSIHVSVAFVLILLLHQNHKNSNQNNCWGFLLLLEIWCCVFFFTLLNLCLFVLTYFSTQILHSNFL